MQSKQQIIRNKIRQRIKKNIEQHKQKISQDTSLPIILMVLNYAPELVNTHTLHPQSHKKLSFSQSTLLTMRTKELSKIHHLYFKQKCKRQSSHPFSNNLNILERCEQKQSFLKYKKQNNFLDTSKPLLEMETNKNVCRQEVKEMKKRYISQKKMKTEFDIMNKYCKDQEKEQKGYIQTDKRIRTDITIEEQIDNMRMKKLYLPRLVNKKVLYLQRLQEIINQLSLINKDRKNVKGMNNLILNEEISWSKIEEIYNKYKIIKENNFPNQTESQVLKRIYQLHMELKMILNEEENNNLRNNKMERLNKLIEMQLFQIKKHNMKYIKKIQFCKKK